jgi:hypothetical protein
MEFFSKVKGRRSKLGIQDKLLGGPILDPQPTPNGQTIGPHMLEQNISASLLRDMQLIPFLHHDELGMN